MDLAKIHIKIEEQLETHLQKIQNYLRIKSINAMATATAKALDELGTTEIYLAETNGYPVVNYCRNLVNRSINISSSSSSFSF